MQIFFIPQRPPAAHFVCTPLAKRELYEEGSRPVWSHATVGVEREELIGGILDDSGAMPMNPIL
jgi:hypothetical protein